MKNRWFGLITSFAFFLVCLAKSAGAQTVQWKQTLPPARLSIPMVFDTLRGVAVFFGGSDSNGQFLNETWEWSGQRWNQRGLGGPSPAARAGTKMAYDSARGVMVLFGGYVSSSLFGDTWEWDGNSWIQRAVTGPSPRYRHAIAYDSVRGVTVLFAGYKQGAPEVLSDIWEWNGTSWNLRNVITPPSFARHGHSMVFDSGRRRIVVFGGYGAGFTPLGNTLEWDGNVWHLITATGPIGRNNQAMVYDSDRGVTVLSGGVNEQVLTDTWEWNGTRWTLRPGNLGRASHGMAYDTVRHVSMVYGGFEQDYSTVSNKHWEWNGTAWSMPAGAVPIRFGHAVAFDTGRNVTTLFGGQSYRTGYLSDTWVWNGFAWIQRVGTGPAARANHAMSFDSTLNQTTLFGGVSQAGTLGDTWVWDGLQWTLRMVNGPSPRRYHKMAYDAARQRTVLFGGMGQLSSELFGDTWEWDGTEWIQRDVAGPSPRASHSMCYDSVRQVIVLYGGGNTGETWEWNGSTWTMRNEGLALSNSQMCFDPSNGLAMQTGFPNTRVWNGVQWTQMYIGSPPSSYPGALAFDLARNAAVFVPGQFADGQEYAETWELFVPCTVPTFQVHPIGQVGCIVSGASFSVSVVAPEPVTYQWQVKQYYGPAIWNNLPDGLSELGLVAGGNASHLTIHDLVFRIPRSLRCLVTTSCGTVISESAVLTLCRGDFNCDGQVEFLDYLDFVQAFSEGRTEADVNRDQAIDLFDYLDYVQFLSETC